MTVEQAATAQVPMMTRITFLCQRDLDGLQLSRNFTVGIQRFPVRSSLGKDDGSDDGGRTGVEENVGLLVARVRGKQIFDKLILNKPTAS